MGVQTIFWTIKCKLNIFMEILLQIAYFKFDDMDDESKQVLPKPLCLSHCIWRPHLMK